MNQDHIIQCGKDQDWIGLAAQESPNRLIEWPGPLPYFHIIGPFPPEGGFVRTPRTPPGYGPGVLGFDADSFVLGYEAACSSNLN